MILTHLDHADRYTAIHPRLARAIEYLRSGAWQGLAAGTYVLEEDALSAIIQRYDTIPLEQGRWEAHRVYTDIQFVAAGAEIIGSGMLEDFNAITEYDAARDVCFFEGTGNLYELRPGMLAILFPHDVHVPRLMVGQPAPVEKVVLKVRVD